MPGEAMHQKGADEARRAKSWLDATTRTRATWTKEDGIAAGRLTFNWRYGSQNEFSADVGGIFFRDPFDKHAFVAEVMKYSADGLATGARLTKRRRLKSPLRSAHDIPPSTGAENRATIRI